MCSRRPRSLYRSLPLFFLFLLSAFASSLHASADPALGLAPGLALGLDRHGGGFVEILNSDFSSRMWRRVNWSRYNSANGETRPTWCDVDGDGKQELVIGLGSGGEGWLNILDDADTDYTSLSWVQVPWAGYNTSNGETFPVCGDLDGDGKDELAVGLGSGGGGYVAILDDANAGYDLLSWVRVNWSAYASANGTVHPAVGNVDGDDADELVLGLGEGGGGWLQIVDDASQSFSTLQWIQGSWRSYNTARGETFPVLCDVDGDGQNELLLGMGAGANGYMEVLNNPATPSTTPTTLGWPRVPWAAYNQANGATYPTCGDLDGDGRDELLVGLGEGSSGYYVALDDSPSGFVSLGWQRGHWASYNNQTGAIHPTLATPSSTGSGLQFDLTGAVSLQALNDIVEETEDSRRRRRSGQRGPLTYRVVSGPWGENQWEGNQRGGNQQETGNHRQGRNAAAVLVSGGNLLAMDENGQTRTVILSSHLAKVMYVVADENREFVYLALDVDASSALVAAENCAIFRVSLTDNNHTCLQEGVYLQAMDEAFIQRFGGRIKPIQRGGEGQIYFAGSPFSVPLSGTNNGITQATWQPLVYRHDPASGTTEAITHDALNIVFFLVLEDGGLVYQGSNTLDAQEKLWLYQAPFSTDLSQAPPAFFFRDTDRSLFWGGRDRNSQPGLFFARPLRDMAGVARAFLPTLLPTGQAVMADQVIIGDNGRLYGLFSQADEGVLIHQLLPFASESTAHFDQPIGGMRPITPTQVARGYLYFMDRYDPGDFRGTKDVIRKQNLVTGERETLLDAGRYEIFTWRVSGHRLYFSGQDKDTTTLIFGWIDTLAVRLGRPVEEYLTLQEVASALGTASEVRDIEILLPQEPPADPGYDPIGLLSSDDAHSFSLEFGKYMDKTSVEENLTFQTASGSDVDLMKIWFYRTLHMIPDLDESGLGDGRGSTPLTEGFSYTLAIDGARDRYGWELLDVTGSLGIHATVTSSGSESTGASPSDVLTIRAMDDQAVMLGETIAATDRFTVTVGEYTNSLGMTFKQLPAGTFTMGSLSSEEGHDDREGPQHQVTISQPFYMGTTEVTQGQWRAVMGSNPSSFSSCGDDCPVENVSWNDAQSFIATLNNRGEGIYRLPTEAEWAYTARAGTTTAYSFGNDASQLDEYAWYGNNSQGSPNSSRSDGKGPHPVATKRANPWGFYDMHGNVYEWVQDWYGSFAASAMTDPVGPSSGSGRVLRSGDWYYGPTSARSANRYDNTPDYRNGHLGLRLFVVVPGDEQGAPPIVSATDGSVGEEETVAIKDFFTVTHGERVARYEVWDSVGGGHFVLNGAELAEDRWVSVSKADMDAGEVGYVGGSEAGSEAVWVRAIDLRGAPSASAEWSMTVTLQQRFIDHGDGTVTDSLTGLMWMKNANCWGRRTWSDTHAQVAALNGGTATCEGYSGAYTDWRVPDLETLQSLIDQENRNPALPSGHPFSSVQSYYWSSTSNARDTDDAWYVYLYDGYVGYTSKTYSRSGWSVRGGP